MNAVEQRIWEWPEPQRQLALVLRDCLLASAPDVTEKVSWNVPVFYHHGWFAYLNRLKKGGIDLCFVRGTQLNNPGTLLERRNRRQIASVPITDLDDLEAKADALNELIAQALRLNETQGKSRIPG